MRSIRAALCVAVLVLCGAALPHHANAYPDVYAQPDADADAEPRYRETVHGGVAVAANSVITCGDPAVPDAAPCADTQAGGVGRGGEYAMDYIDVDDDRNTYNSSRAELRLPAGAEVAYARLYWGANIRVGEQKPPEDNARVLIAEPGGAYKEVVAESAEVHAIEAPGYQSFVASAEVTDLVRYSSPGAYTVGQVNVAMGHSETGGWGGWALVVAYEDADEPLRELAILDGLPALDGSGRAAEVTVDGLRIAPDAAGGLGVVAFGGDRGQAGDGVTVRPDGGEDVELGDAANPAYDVMNSTISGGGEPVAEGREPAHANTLGFDADVLDLGAALTGGPEELRLRFTSGRDAYQLGAVFLQADARTGTRTQAGADAGADAGRRR
ncbi:DUF3344 domain-containing protein [Streptomyces sp. 6N223]|uniref:DUF3344 domain-containing protein n=1 Tax=Streptomyces sp. 6N223 TaxID=3457412 RepID=UPI003FCF7625